MVSDLQLLIEELDHLKSELQGFNGERIDALRRAPAAEEPGSDEHDGGDDHGAADALEPDEVKSERTDGLASGDDLAELAEARDEEKAKKDEDEEDEE